MNKSEGWKFVNFDGKRRSKLKHALDAETLKRLILEKGLTISGLADEYGVTETHFRRLLQDRVSLNEAIRSAMAEYIERKKLNLP
jgi:transcriptional regulator with XRE-family HTH domain